MSPSGGKAGKPHFTGKILTFLNFLGWSSIRTRAAVADTHPDMVQMPELVTILGDKQTLRDHQFAPVPRLREDDTHDIELTNTFPKFGPQKDQI